MRIPVPGIRERRTVDRLLTAYFRDHNLADFRQAIVRLSRFYRLPTPPVHWYEYLDWGKTGGRTYENGRIHLVHPENWKRGRKYCSERQWIFTVYHEMGHYVLWSDPERKADTFAWRLIRGIAQRTTPTADRLTIAGSRARRKGPLKRSSSPPRPLQARSR